MEVDCEGCAGCCLDWRPLTDADGDRERSGRRVSPGEDGGGDRRPSRHEPIDDAYNLVPLTRDEVRGFLEAGLGDALTPRLWAAEDDDRSVAVDGRSVAAIAGRPAFFVGLRKPPKPTAPFDREEATWLPTCVFLDPTTLQCRIHGDDRYPAECEDYPAHNLALDQETECERVEDAAGGDRLIDDTVDESDFDGREGLLLGPQAVGQKVFCHPRPDDLDGIVGRIAADDATAEDRAEFVAVAAASSPGTLATSDHHYEEGKSRALAADSWVGRAIEEWTRLADDGRRPNADLAERVEGERGAPETPGWDDV